jgi:hypothetical protein
MDLLGFSFATILKDQILSTTAYRLLQKIGEEEKKLMP